MRLSTTLIKNFINVNVWETTDTLFVREGQSNDLYFQLVDLDRGSKRYISPTAVGSLSLKATFYSIDGQNTFEITGTCVSADDKSLWKISLTDAQLPSSGAVRFEFIEGSTTYKFIVQQVIATELLAQGSC